MSRQSLTAVRSQAGFTLVELAVVMIIIGLLIGGVLKGQELINNAQITSTVAQIKAMDAATSTFDDMYSALPGDMLNPDTRLPNCAAAPCDAAGNGDRALDDAFTAAPAGEGEQFFVHLAAADLLTGINPAGVATAWGSIYPEANISGGFHAGSTTGAATQFSNIVGAANPPRGLYLGITATAGAIPTETLTPNQAFRIDNKVDDSSPDSGSVRGYGGTCSVTAAEYDEQNPAEVCGLYIRIQG